MTPAESAYRMLLRAYPAGFRATFGAEMIQAFRDLRRENRAGGVRFWAPMIWDVARSAPAQRVAAMRESWNGNTQPEEGKMKTMAILAVLIGALEAVNAMGEVWAGGIVNHGGYSLAIGSLGIATGLLLVAAAVSLLRRSAGAAAFAQGAAIACLTVFTLVAVLRPIFSVAATILGIAFPIAMLIYLRVTSGRGPAARVAA